jgi:hypothetical protein
VDLFGSSCACAPIAANKKVAIAKERATVKDSLSDEKMEQLDELFDVLIENASHFWKVDMACHSALRKGGLHGVQWSHERRRSALSEESQFLTFCVAWGRMVAEVRTQGRKILREKFDGSMAEQSYPGYCRGYACFTFSRFRVTIKGGLMQLTNHVGDGLGQECTGGSKWPFISQVSELSGDIWIRQTDCRKFCVA